VWPASASVCPRRCILPHPTSLTPCVAVWPARSTCFVVPKAGSVDVLRSALQRLTRREKPPDPPRAGQCPRRRGWYGQCTSRMSETACQRQESRAREGAFMRLRPARIIPRAFRALCSGCVLPSASPSEGAGFRSPVALMTAPIIGATAGRAWPSVDRTRPHRKLNLLYPAPTCHASGRLRSLPMLSAASIVRPHPLETCRSQMPYRLRGRGKTPRPCHGVAVGLAVRACRQMAVMDRDGWQAVVRARRPGGCWRPVVV
jgi:hypothetical protein